MISDTPSIISFFIKFLAFVPFFYILFIVEREFLSSPTLLEDCVLEIYDPEEEEEREKQEEERRKFEELDNESLEESIKNFTRLDDSVFQLDRKIETTFDDVAGNEQAKEELKEVVQFLTNPESFLKLGATMPKGILLDGPPGTGKTLLARAVAGEAKVPFFRVSGSEFVQLLVGVGAARVRELFERARAVKPTIIFIDEIDSIARVRAPNASMGGGVNDEREQTLNQILTELDGFQQNTDIVVIAATNRSDILDPALKRPGRFDRQITLTNPNISERESILKVHTRGKKLDSSVSLSLIAQRTLGFSGADLANLLNEAAILAIRRQKSIITMEDINTSIDRLILGLEGKQIKRIKTRQLVGFQKIAEAIMTTLLQEDEEVEKVSLLPRGNRMGITWTIPSLSQFRTRLYLINQILINLSGRAMEENVQGLAECTASTQQNIIELTRILRSMITRYAFSRLKEIKQPSQQRNLFLLGSDVKQELTNSVDLFMTSFVSSMYSELLSFLTKTRPIGERIVDELLNDEELKGYELRGLLQEYLGSYVKKEPLMELQDRLLFEAIQKLRENKQNQKEENK
jgi:cell division protease FtsH